MLPPLQVVERNMELSVRAGMGLPAELHLVGGGAKVPAVIEAGTIVLR